MVKRYRTSIQTPLGTMVAVSNGDALQLLGFDDGKTTSKDITMLGALEEAACPILDQTRRELSAYFKGQIDAFTVPLAPLGTDFQQRSWQALQTIPYGHTRSYSEQALQVGNAKALRAVARANGANRVSIIIPCHRVIGKDGSLTGFSSGIERKKWLLAHEQKYAKAA